MKTENMTNGGSYTINPETEAVALESRTISQEQAAAEQAAAEAKSGKKGKQTEGDK